MQRYALLQLRAVRGEAQRKTRKGKSAPIRVKVASLQLRVRILSRISELLSQFMGRLTPCKCTENKPTCARRKRCKRSVHMHHAYSKARMPQSR